MCIGSCSRSGSYQIDQPVAVVAPAHVKQKAAGVTGGYTPKYKYAGDDYNATCSVKLPSLTPGTYYIYVKVDADNNVYRNILRIRSEIFLIRFLLYHFIR